MKKSHLLKSLKSHIIVYFSIIFIIVISLIGITGYAFFSKVLTNEILTYSTRIIDEANINIDSYFSQIKTLVQITASNNEIVEGLKNDKVGDYTNKLSYNRKIEDILQETLKFNSKIKDFIIVKSDGTVYNSSGRAVKTDYNFYEQDWFPEYNEKLAKVTFIGNHAQDYYYVNNSSNMGNVVSAVVPIMDYVDPQRNFYAMLICNLNVKEIQEITKDTVLEKSGYFLLIDNNNEIIYKPGGKNISNDFKDRLVKEISGESGNFILKSNPSDMVVVYKTSEVTGWRIISLIPKNEILGHLDSIKSFTVFFIIMGILIVIIASFFISGKVTTPITELLEKMKGIEEGDFSIKLYDDSTEEIEILSSRMDIMVDRINKLNKDIYSYEIKSKEAEIKALQAQINPHFLYNTLQSIKAMAVCDKTHDISKMVTLVGNMLRYAIYDSEELVTIQSEIDHVKEYLQIQNYRYPGKFRFDIYCDKKVSKYKTLKLILQPIVENSILHGLKESKEGIIYINIEEDDLNVRFEVIDNGKGMSEDEVRGIMNYINDITQTDYSSSIGLKNVHDRIRLKYGMPYGIDIISHIDKGTCVNINIPIINSEGEMQIENGNSR